MSEVTENPALRVLVNAHASVGEGPFWDTEHTRLHWVDIPAGRLHTSDPTTGQTTTVTVPTTLGAAIPRTLGGFVAATGEGFAVIDATGRLTPRLSFLPDGFRMNDAKCDPAGRLWAGSTALDFTPGHGALHVLEPDWSTRVVLDGLTLPNGIGFSPDCSTMYLADTFAHRVYAFDFDPAAAAITRQRILIDFAAEGALPDGLAIDADGHLWIAMWGGARLLRVSPAGTVEREVPLPVRQPSSCAFIGTGLDLLAITSAAEDLAPANSPGPDGAVLALTGLPAPGIPVAGFSG